MVVTDVQFVWWMICTIRVSPYDPAKRKVENKQVKMPGALNKHEWQ
jgi:hypothetical protein